MGLIVLEIFTMAAIVVLVALLLGLAFGSFLNVVLSRLPRGESLLSPPSHCRSCARRLAWWENVPVASYLALRGRCRTCGASIGIRYLLVELAAGLSAAVAAANWVQRGGLSRG